MDLRGSASNPLARFELALVVALGGLAAAGAPFASAALAPPPPGPVAGDCHSAPAPAGYTAVDLQTPVNPAATATARVSIPAGAGTVTFDVCGAQGGEPFGTGVAGLGGETAATLALPGPASYDVVVGAQGTDGGTRAYGGGGAGNDGGTGPGAGFGGGGGSYVFTAGTTTPVVIAGGGGGVWSDFDCGAGAGGGTEGASARPVDAAVPCEGDDVAPAGGGTQTGPGAGGISGGPLNTNPFALPACEANFCEGSPGQSLQGGDATARQSAGGGGGGGGLWGGGGGGGWSGGGGSGFVPAGASNTSMLTGVQQGDGAVRILYGIPLAFTSAPIADSVLAGTAYSKIVTMAANSATPTVGISVGTLPAGLALVDNNNGTATISGTPTTAGTAAFTLRGSNAIATDVLQSGSLTVSAPPPPPPPPPPATTGGVTTGGSTTTGGATTTGGTTGATTGGTTGGTTGAVQSSSPQPGQASPSPSSTASPSGRKVLTLVAGLADIQPTQAALLTATGSAGQAIRLQCYSRPSTSYVTARTATIDATGSPVTFQIKPGTNTRCFSEYVINPLQDVSKSTVVNVHTSLSLSAVRTGVRTYMFQGRNLPRIAGQLITLYRVTGDGTEIRTANLATDASGIYRVTRVFTGTGAYQFRVRTSKTLNNAPGVSNVIAVTIR